MRCLAYCREQNWIASGSFDRTIKLWDRNRTSTNEPLITLNPPDATAPKSSIYAMACDPFGHAIASGSPERVIRIWDPRSGKRTGKLVGHTDNIRAILISEDSKYVSYRSAKCQKQMLILYQLLTGSADGMYLGITTYCFHLTCFPSLDQTLVSSIAALSPHFHASCRFCMVSLLFASLSRNILLG